MDIYYFKIISISRNKYIKFIIVCKFVLNGIELCNVNCAFKFGLQKLRKLFFPVNE